MTIVTKWTSIVVIPLLSQVIDDVPVYACESKSAEEQKKR